VPRQVGGSTGGGARRAHWNGFDPQADARVPGKNRARLE
jgi:hypothetical protein